MSSIVNWREHLAVHPAAELFPLMSEAELRELADDIKKNGLQTPIVLSSEKSPSYLLDGRNRLDALELLGWLLPPSKGSGDPFRLSPDFGISLGGFPRVSRLQAIVKHCSGDPYAIALALNVHRRHLTADQKRDLIAKVLKAKPDASNRQVAKQVKADDKTVASVRRDLESTAEIPQLDKTIGEDGKARKKRKELKAETVKVRLAGETLKSLDGFSDTAKQQIAEAVTENTPQKLAEAVPPPAAPTTPRLPSIHLRSVFTMSRQKAEKFIKETADMMAGMIGGGATVSVKVQFTPVQGKSEVVIEVESGVLRGDKMKGAA